jgi:hypothetical protein
MSIVLVEYLHSLWLIIPSKFMDCIISLPPRVFSCLPSMVSYFSTLLNILYYLSDIHTSLLNQ